MQAGPLRHLPWIIPTALLTLVLVVGGAAFYMLYQHDRLVTRQQETGALEVQNLQRDLGRQKADSEALRAQMTVLEGQNATLQEKAAHPHVVIWNVAQQVRGPSDYLAGGVPDTFTYHLKLSSTAPMSVAILSFHQFADGSDCVRRGLGTTHYCMHRQGGQNWNDVTGLDIDFHDAEGCAAYLSVITAATPTTVTPDVSVTYNPASHGTGTCAG